MTGNRSLDEFLAGNDADSAPDERSVPEAPDGAASASADTGSDDPTETASVENENDEDRPVVEPMAETFTWSAAGGSCASCGERVETRWRDAGTLVCENCKEW